jgi:hypothetical protein
MHTIKNSNINGFKAYTRQVRIYDKSGKPFYFFDVKTKLLEPHTFNLPAGIYYSETPLDRLAAPIKYELPNLAKPNRYIQKKPRIKIMYGNNPHTCSIDVSKGVIFADNKLKELPAYMQKFIFLHEIAHHYYGGYDFKTQKKEYTQAEINCDTYAAFQMLRSGYNPSQAHLTVKNMLSDWKSRADSSLKINKKAKKIN